MEVAIIGGTGVYDPGILTDRKEINVQTPYGPVNAMAGVYNGIEVVFLPRHGVGHSVPPHRINYRANIWGLRRLGVKRIIATTAVGSLNPKMRPGEMVIIDQFLDFTKGRPSTFFEGGPHGVVHVDYTEPYCPEIRAEIRKAAASFGYQAHDGGVYVCTEGPRFETPAEIRMFAKLGGDLVGMTNVPEVVLAREAGICYATISMVTNYAAGMATGPLTHEEVVALMQENTQRLRQVIVAVLKTLPKAQNCSCQSAVPNGDLLFKED
ncbi:MAG TPA: S-methyl-5'-thioadenosine phosphorylase [Firmicutes bacterium]|jgi:5'-methylthioadenosine phosphorylase|nr:S-methyl-5'-thioadenosine phosphorylase [Bacillota bacterium]